MQVNVPTSQGNQVDARSLVPNKITKSKTCQAKKKGKVQLLPPNHNFMIKTVKVKNLWHIVNMLKCVILHLKCNHKDSM